MSAPQARLPHPLLGDAPDHVALLLGNEAVVRGALEAGVAFAAGYPGTPSSEVTDSLARVANQRGIVFEYSVNEKVALEMAFAASLGGARSICAMKHLGLMVAGDPISTIPYVGVDAGMVILSAGDPSCLTSPNEQDQRHLGAMLHIPTLDPSTPQEAYEFSRLAFELSEESRLPVLLRITTRVAHSRGTVRCGPLRSPQVAGYHRDPSRQVPIPVNARRLRTLIPGRLEKAREYARRLLRHQGQGRRAILAAGVPAATTTDLLREAGVEDEVLLVVLGAVWPLPERELADLLREVDEVLVVEELSPFLEERLQALCHREGLRTRVLGKHSGHLPVEFEYEPGVIARGLHEALGLGQAPAPPREPPPAPPRPPVLCPGCPHRSSYFAVRAAFPEETLYFSDIGCYTLGYGPPLDTADAVLCMGAAYTLAGGVSRVTGQRTVGFMGDSTFFHAGMPPLLNAIKEDVNMVAVILDNDVTAMTGFQESPTISVVDGTPRRETSIEGVARALGARHVEVVDPMDLAATIAAFERAREQTGVSVIISRHSCPMFLARETGSMRRAVAYEIDHTRCRTCGRECQTMRCSLEVTEEYERHRARSRALRGPGALDEEGHQHRVPEVAPCSIRCPLGLCVQGYLGHVAAGRHAEALELILSRTPLPEVVCRICHRPCEQVCVRRVDGEAIAINDVKRFVVEWARQAGKDLAGPTPAPDTGRHVAVVGAGPAGLGAAWELRRRGHRVTLFDAGAQPGGQLRSIPPFRLPAEALQRDLDRLVGEVSFHGERRLGADLELDELLREHDAVVLAVGASQPSPADLPGEGGPPVVGARQVLSGARACQGQRVVVVGDGYEAVDAARVALRGGAVSATVATGARELGLPVPDLDQARREGVEARSRLQVETLTAGGLRCRDRDGKGVLLEADLVVIVPASTPDARWLREAAPTLAWNEDGALQADGDSGQTSDPRVFASGDLLGAGGTVVEALASGMRAAWGVDVQLRGAGTADHRPPPPRRTTWPSPRGLRPSSEAPHQRSAPPELSLAARPEEAEVVGTYDETTAHREAGACLMCGQCGNCSSCLDLFGCPAFYLENGLVHINPDLCNGCGVCAAFCPNRAIRPVQEPEA